MDWTLTGLIILVVFNILAWVFAAGKMTGRVNTRLNNVEKRLDDPQILPQCAELFAEIRERLASLGVAIKEFQKNNEKKHIRNEKQ